MEQHLEQLPDRQAELERAFGFMVEKRQITNDDHMTGCTSFLQRRLQCGYNRAAQLMEDMVALGWITDADRNGTRRITRAHGPSTKER